MTLECQKRVIAIHAVAVVGNADELAAACFDFDADPIRAGVQGVLKQFLDHRRGAVDHFAGGNLIGYLIRKNTNAPHEMRLAGKIIHSGFWEYGDREKTTTEMRDISER